MYVQGIKEKFTSRSVASHYLDLTLFHFAGTKPIIFIMESIIEPVAKSLGMSPDEVRKVNLYKKGDVTPCRQPLTYFNVDTILSRKRVSSCTAILSHINDEHVKGLKNMQRKILPLMSTELKKV